MPEEKAPSSGSSCQHRRCIFAPASRRIFAPALTRYVFTIGRVAEILAEDEDWLQEIALELEPEDGHLTV